MVEGQAWYIDFSLPHRVSNMGDEDRVHLVMDCGVDEWLETMIPFTCEVQSQAQDFVEQEHAVPFDGHRDG